MPIEVKLPTSDHADPDLASALAIAGDDTVFVGTVEGRMYRVTRGAAGWAGASVTPLGALANQYVSDIVVASPNARTLWVSCSQAGGPHVFRSTDGGKSWVNRSANLPDVAVLHAGGRLLAPAHAAAARGKWTSRPAATPRWRGAAQPTVRRRAMRRRRLLAAHPGRATAPRG